MQLTAPRGAFALLFALGIAASARAENRMSIPDRTLLAGSTGVQLFIHASHDFALSGFSISIRYRPQDLSITDVTTSGTSLDLLPEPIAFFNGTVDGARGTIAYGAVFDFSTPLRSYLAPGPDHTIAVLVADVHLAPGGSSPVLLEDGLGGSFPINNLLVDQNANPVSPTLTSGTVRVDPAPPLFADAGPSQLVVENGPVHLDGTQSNSPVGRPLTYLWTQTNGVPAQALQGQDGPTPSYFMPGVDGDQTLSFHLQLSDGLTTAGSDVTVTVVDVNLRAAGLEAGTGAGLLIDGGRRAVLFTGVIRWGTNLEDALWSLARFTSGGQGDESKLLGAISLYLDENNDGAFDPSDRLLGGPQTVTGNDGQVTFQFTERIEQSAPRRFFLVAEVPSPAAPSAGLLLPGALAAGGALLAARRRTRGRRSARGGAASGRGSASRFVALFALTLLPLLGVSCGGGGGHHGGGGPAVIPAGSREVRFSLSDPSDLQLQGVITQVPGSVSGTPLTGPALNV